MQAASDRQREHRIPNVGLGDQEGGGQQRRLEPSNIMKPGTEAAAAGLHNGRPAGAAEQQDQAEAGQLHRLEAEPTRLGSSAVGTVDIGEQQGDGSRQQHYGDTEGQQRDRDAGGTTPAAPTQHARNAQRRRGTTWSPAPSSPAALRPPRRGRGSRPPSPGRGSTEQSPPPAISQSSSRSPLIRSGARGPDGDHDHRTLNRARLVMSPSSAATIHNQRDAPPAGSRGLRQNWKWWCSGAHI